MDIVIILLCVPLYVVNSFCDKYLSAKAGESYNAAYNALKFLLGSILLFPLFLIDGAPRFEWGAIVCGVGCGVTYAVNKTLMIKGLQQSSVSFMTFCHAAGMIIPCILGHFLWDEPMSLFSAVGIVLAVLSIILIKDAKKEGQKKPLGLVIGLLILLTSGGVMIMQKCMGKYFANQSVSAYNFYSFIVAFILLLLFIKQKPEKQTLFKTLLPCASGSALSLCAISLVMTALSATVPSVIMFPLFNGTGIILVALLSALFFKEKLTKNKIIGLLVGLVGLCLVNF